MRIRKPIASVIVAALVATAAALGLSAPAAAWTTFPTESGDWRYVFDNTQARITGYYGPGGSVEVPETLGGKTVVSIYNRAMYRKGLTSVELPATVTSIGTDAFAENDITYINVPANLVTIQSGAFASNQLEHIGLEVATGLAYIGSQAFISNHLEQVTVPSSVQRLETRAFAHNHLTQFTVGGGAMEYFFPSAFEDQTRRGELFADWRDAASDGNHVDLNDRSVWENPGRDTYYAHYVDAHIVTFDPQTGSSGDRFESHVPLGGTASEPSAPSRAHHTFSGWHTNASAGTEWDFDATVTGDMTLWAQWAPVDYSVTYAGEGDGLPASETVTYPGAASEPADPTREHYTFTGWVDDTESPWDFDATITADTTLTATWDPLDYTVSFAGDGSGIPADATVTYPATVAEPADPSREHYTFTGWVDDTGSAWDFDTTVTTDTTLTAAWSANSYDATFDSKGGSDVPTHSVVYPGTIVEPAAPTRDHYAFGGWVGDADQPWDFDATITADTALTATWTPLDYTVAFDPARGTPTPAQTITYPGTATLPAEPTRTHYAFSGWVGDTDNPWDFDATVTADTTVTATWTPNDYTLTFDPGNGEDPHVAVVTYPEPANPPTNPFLSGHTFTGWVGSDGSAWNAGTAVTTDTTVTAVYTENVRTIIAPAQVALGDTIELSGSGFDPGEPVEIELHSTPMTLDTVRASAAGDFSANVTIPTSIAPGSHELVLVSASGTVSKPLTVDPVELEETPADGGGVPADDAVEQSSTPGSTLPTTGPEATAASAWFAVVLALAGAGLIALRRRA
ncbi:InlB B-repeat-containing protein [Demequina flava]|uniref:InlB B-repeat-containing protein n=1 Tax=Demequina flava TaxID=1095025 RepID=UPI000785370E|nr:InlB B-repeat-containing protein [Demequina flava]